MIRVFCYMSLVSLTAFLPCFVPDSYADKPQGNKIQAAHTQAMPEFTQTSPKDWVHSKPLSLQNLKGRVVLLHFWTFACWNCTRSFPWLTELESSLKEKGLTVIGVHSPEFDYEKNPLSVKEKTAEFKLTHPVMIDNQHSYWKAVGNRYWPAYYLIDKKGIIRARFVGETHKGDPQSKKIKKTLTDLLAE